VSLSSERTGRTSYTCDESSAIWLNLQELRKEGRGRGFMGIGREALNSFLKQAGGKKEKREILSLRRRISEAKCSEWTIGKAGRV